MYFSRFAILFSLLILAACRPLAPQQIAATPTHEPKPTLAPTITLPPAPTQVSTPTDRPQELVLTRPFTVITQPDGPLYVGDRVSFEVIANSESALQDQQVQVALGASDGALLGEGSFGRFGIGGRQQATLYWVWDTSDLAPGEYPLVFTAGQGTHVWTEVFTLLPADQAPPPEPQAAWAQAESQCCLIHYISGTTAERDLAALQELADGLAEEAAEALNVSVEELLPLTLVPRVLGHGGFTGQGISLSYLDRNYAGSSTATVLKHEFVHLLDSHREAEKPSILVEGLAVYLTGGHFKAEPLMPRAAALLPPLPDCTADHQPCGLDRYLPLAELTDDFYHAQHETGYLQAGALVEFMVQTWGWEAFDRFYLDIKPPAQPNQAGNQPPAQASVKLGAALQRHFGIDLPGLEDRFRQALGDLPVSQNHVDDVRLTIAFYDSVRRYQLLLDPSAHFLTAWLPDADQMRQKGIAADYLRHPVQLENLALETMLIEADSALRAGDFRQAQAYIDSLNRVLDAVQAGRANPLSEDPMAADHLSVAEVLSRAGYQPQRISVENDTARALVSADGVQISEIVLYRTGSDWSLDVGAYVLPGMAFTERFWALFHQPDNRVASDQ